jgi:excisionase family DNA binding protein
VAEVGRQLGLRKSRVYELAAAGLIPVIRMGRRLHFPRRGLDALADEAIAAIARARGGTRPVTGPEVPDAASRVRARRGS